MMFNDLNHFKSVVAHQFFVEPGDRNYSVARFCRLSNLYEEYWWQILQMVEKYLKATIILNGGSAKATGHDLKNLLEKHSQFLKSDGIKRLDKPEGLRSELWSDKPIESLLVRIQMMGNPDSRYGLTSYWNRPEDAFVADQLAFELRRRTIGLDWIVGQHWEDCELRDYYGKPYRHVIRNLPRHQVRQMKIPDKDLSVAGTSTCDILHSWNFAFTRAEEDINKPAPPSFAPMMGAMRNSYLGIFYRAFLKSERSAIREHVLWLLENIRLGPAEPSFRALLD